MIRWFERYARPENAATNLAVIRFLYFSAIFFLIGLLPYFGLWREVPHEFWLPTGPMLFFLSPPISDEVHRVLFEFWRWSLPLCALGFFYRVLAPLGFIAGFILMNFAHSFGYQGHIFMPVLLAGLPLAFANASDVLSLDAWVLKLKRRDDARIYVWPIRSMQLVFVLVFLTAGISKLRTSGFDWFLTDHLRNYFLRASIVFDDVNHTAHAVLLNRKLYDYPLFCQVLAALTIFFEILAPLAFFSRRSARVIVPIIFVMQIAIYFTLFVNFRLYSTLYLAWIDWAWLAHTMRSKRFALRRPVDA